MLTILGTGMVDIYTNNAKFVFVKNPSGRHSLAVVNAFVVLKIDQAEKVYIVCIRVPTQTGKPGKWEGIFQSGKSPGILNRLEESGKKSGKITQNTGKVRESQTNTFCYFFSDI